MIDEKFEKKLKENPKLAKRFYARFIDITGQQFDNLTAIKYMGNRKWLCRCKCGNEILTTGTSLRNHKAKSCGIGKCSPNFDDLTGKTLGNLYVEELDHITTTGHSYYRCKCLKCGKSKIISRKILLADKYACGCQKIKHNMTGTRFYRLYLAIKQRCNNPNAHAYKDYGGRGIKICERWENFLNFKEDMYESYLEHVKQYGEKNTSIDRIDNDGNYCKENCRWVTQKEQCSNTRKTIYLTYNGETHTIAEWSKITGIRHKLLYGRIFEKFWDVEKALTTPVRK